MIEKIVNLPVRYAHDVRHSVQSFEEADQLKVKGYVSVDDLKELQQNLAVEFNKHQDQLKGRDELIKRLYRFLHEMGTLMNGLEEDLSVMRAQQERHVLFTPSEIQEILQGAGATPDYVDKIIQQMGGLGGKPDATQPT